MCYVTYVALSRPFPVPEPGALLAIRSVAVGKEPDEVVQENWFSLPHIYYLGSSTGCSCEFRYWDADFGFCPPQDWASEVPKDSKIRATVLIAQWLRQAVAEGITAEIIAHWNGEPLPEAVLSVNMDRMKNEEFVLVTDKKMIVRK